MKITIPETILQHPRNIMRGCGYGELMKRSGDVSYTKRAGSGEFPRFHAYISDNTINLHLDQKAACYSGSSAHSGEYDGDVVEKEGERIRRIILE